MGRLPGPKNIESSAILDVPGPGAYDPDAGYPSQSFKIKRDSAPTKKKSLEPAVGPETYTPLQPGKAKKGIVFGRSNELYWERNGYKYAKSRHSLSVQKFEVPGSNQYTLVGDFDFKDTNDPNSRGKMPKFAYGMKTEGVNASVEAPGPGSYETDVRPANHK